MSASKEFYYDDLVISSDEGTRLTSVGLVTKEKPCNPPFLKPFTNKKKNHSGNVTATNENEEVKNDKLALSSIDVCESEDEEDDISDGNLYDPPQTEMVNVSWFVHKYLSIIGDSYDNNFVESVPGKNLQLLDRNMEISDIVKMTSNNEVKVGAIFDIKMKADVLILGLNKVIKDVDCSRLKWIEPFMGKNLETNFTYNSWLGEVLDISVEVIVRFSDGARLKVPDTALNQFEYQIHSIWNPDIVLENCIMEGDALDLRSRKSKFLTETVTHNSKWLSRLRKGENVQILVERVIPTHADMQWIFGYNNQSTSVVAEAPPQTLKGKELEKLEQVHPHSWYSVSVGDVWYYQMNEGDTLLDCNQTDELGCIVYSLINKELLESKPVTDCFENNDASSIPSLNDSPDNQTFVCTSGYVIKPHKKVLCSSKSRKKRTRLSSKTANPFTSDTDEAAPDDDEQEGSVEKSPTQEPKDNPGEECKQVRHRKFVIEKLKEDILSKINVNTKKGSNWNLPVGILLTRTFVDINWQDGTVDREVPTTRLIPQMYNIDEHDFFPGDFVVQKFDPHNPVCAESNHNFGTVIKSNTIERVATVQWFDYVTNNTESFKPKDMKENCTVEKAGNPEEVGVYDIAALNEHHFMLGQEVIVKQESTHKNYPAGYVSKLEIDEGRIIVRWPDGMEMGVSPTDLLLTVESAVGGGGAGFHGGVGIDSSEFDASDDIDDRDESSFDTSDLDSDDNEDEGKNSVTDSGGGDDDGNSSQGSWVTIEEEDGNLEDEAYQKKLDQTRIELLKLRKKLVKVNRILSNVSDFTTIIQSHLPPHMGQLLNVKNIFINEESTTRNDADDLNSTTNSQSHNPKCDTLESKTNAPITICELTLPDQLFALRTLFEIRRNIGLIYKQCKDVEIKRMFQNYKPRNFLSFRNIKNFIVSNIQYSKCSTTKPGTNNLIENDDTNPEVINNVDLESNTSRDQNVEKLTADYLVSVYESISQNLSHLLESIDVWLNERSCYFSNKEEIILDSDSGVSHQSDEGNVDTVRASLTGHDPDSDHDITNNPLVNDIINADQVTSPLPISLISQQTGMNVVDYIISDCVNNVTNGEFNKGVSLSSPAPENGSTAPVPVHHFTESDRTMSSNCEPIPEEQRGMFIMSDMAPSSHHFINSLQPSISNNRYCKAWKRDLKLLSTSLPKGVIVKSFDNRTDLFSVMIVGPAGTPYQHALFFFDIQLGNQYPTAPPNVYFISLATERVNPNLYTEGRVCLSLLGTWNGKGTENWDNKLSNMLQLIVSLQGLILVSEPYYNEAGFEIRKGSEEGKENSQKYNENAINNICQSMINLLHKPLSVFDNEIRQHFEQFGQSLIDIHQLWASLDESCCNKIKQQSDNTNQLPDFPLAPVSKGFQLSMNRHITSLKTIFSQKLTQWSSDIPAESITSSQ